MFGKKRLDKCLDEGENYVQKYCEEKRERERWEMMYKGLRDKELKECPVCNKKDKLEFSNWGFDGCGEMIGMLCCNRCNLSMSGSVLNILEKWNGRV